MPVDLLGMVLFAGSMIGTPGPANMLVMASGARFGFARSVPFLAGVILGKQAIVWPVGLGLLTLIPPESLAFQALKWASVGYILYLAWKIAGTRMARAEAGTAPPGFASGLIVHPLNPKAWAMLVGSYTNFTDPAAPALMVTAIVAVVVLLLQVVLQTFWTYAGERVAATVAGGPGEVWLMRGLAALVLLSVLFALK